MKFKFTDKAKTRATAFSDKTPTGPKSQTFLIFKKIGTDWQSELADGIELAEGKREETEAAFFEWLTNQAPAATAESSATVKKSSTVQPTPPTEPEDLRPIAEIPAPKPHPVSGTTSPEYLEYAAANFTDGPFSELYEIRWHKPKFRTYAEAVAPTFHTRASKLFPADH